MVQLVVDARTQDTLRLDAVGDVARPLLLEEVHRVLVPTANAVRLRKLPELALLAVLAPAIGRGRNTRRGALAMRHAGRMVRAVVSMIALDVRDPARVGELHEDVRALSDVCLDALDDVLANVPPVRPILEAERMWRAGLLREDWTMRVAGAAPLRAVVVALIRPAVAEA